MILSKELQRIGLQEKEAKVYMAALEMGPETAQNIASKAEVKRATAYFVMEKLMKLGLFSSYHKGKRQFFVAESPKALLHYLEKEQREIEEKKQLVVNLLPALESVASESEKNKPVVKFYVGKEGMEALDSYIYSRKDIDTEEWYYLAPMDKIRNVRTEEQEQTYLKRRIEKNIRARTIYTQKEGQRPNDRQTKRIKVSEEEYPIECQVSISKDVVTFVTFDEKQVGVSIENKDIVRTIRSLFELAWKGIEKTDS